MSITAAAEARTVFIASDGGFMEARLDLSGDSEPVASFVTSIAKLYELRAPARQRGEGQEAALFAFADAMAAAGLSRDEMLWELAEAHWSEDGSQSPPPGGEAAHNDLMARLGVHVSAAMRRKAFDIARQCLAEFVAEDGRPTDGELPVWEVERVAEAVAWSVDIEAGEEVIEALNEAAAAEGLHIGRDEQPEAIERARLAHRERWACRGYFFSEEAEAGRAREDAWSRAFDQAEELFGESEPLPTVAAKVAVEIAGLDVDGVADAVVTAAHLAGIKLREGAYAAAQAAATAARWGKELEPASAPADPYLAALDAAPSMLAHASSGDLPGSLAKRFGLVDREAEEIATAVIADAEAEASGLRAFLAKRSAPAPAPAPVAVGVEPAAEVEPKAASTNGPRELAFELESEPGLLGEIARWFDRRAYRPVAEFNLPAVLGLGAALFGRRLATPTALGLNLYLIGTAETTGGKDALVSGPESVLSACNLRHLRGPGDFASDAAIEKAIRTRPNHLMSIDEFGKLAQAMYGRNAPHFVKLAAKSILALYPRSQPNSEWTGKERATDERDSASDVVISPTLSILGVSTPEGMFDGVPETITNDGTLNRFTLFVGGKPGARQRDPKRLEVPSDLVNRVRAAYSASGSPGDLTEAAYRSASQRPAIRIVPWANAEAEAAFFAIEDWQDDAEERGMKGFAGRAGEQSIKIATIRAAFRDPGNPAVTADDIAWSFAIVHKSIRDLEAGVRANMASSEFGLVLNAVQRAIVGAGPKGISRTKLLSAPGVRHADDRFVKTALERLEATEVIWPAVLRPGQGGKMGARYIAREFDGA